MLDVRYDISFCYKAYKEKKIQGDQKVSVHLMITIQSSGAQRLFDHSV